MLSFVPGIPSKNRARAPHNWAEHPKFSLMPTGREPPPRERPPFDKGGCGWLTEFFQNHGGDRVRVLRPSARSHPHFLAVRPECNPSAHTTVASRACDCKHFSPPIKPEPSRGRMVRQYSRRAGEHDGADLAELDTHSKHFSPPPLNPSYSSRGRDAVRQYCGHRLPQLDY